MRTTSLIAVLVAVTLAATACIEVRVNDRRSIHASGDIETIAYDLSGFDAVAIASAFSAEITAGDQFAVEVEIDRNLRDHLEVEVRNGELRIGLQRFTRSRGDLVKRARITIPALRALHVSGASHVTLHGIDAPTAQLVAEVSGASDLRGDLVTGDLRATLSGASHVHLVGSAQAAAVELSGASRARLEAFQAGSLEAELSGASSAEVAVTERLGPVRLSGASTLRYAGDPAVADVQTTGASNISRR
jgi:hypothetical protein